METVALAALSRIMDTLLSPAVGGVILTLAGLMLADFVTALAAAARAKDVEPLILGEFLRTHVMGRWVPIVALIILSTISQPLVAIAGLGVAAYTVETAASIKANLGLAKTAADDSSRG